MRDIAPGSNNRPLLVDVPASPTTAPWTRVRRAGLRAAPWPKAIPGMRQDDYWLVPRAAGYNSPELRRSTQGADSLKTSRWRLRGPPPFARFGLSRGLPPPADPERRGPIHSRRAWLASSLALVVAVAVVPLAPRVAAADAGTSYAANCTVRLRAAPATSATSLVSMPAGTIVTATGSVAGGSWSATCPTAVSGSTWYAISAVDGTSVATLYGVSVAYAAAGLFTLSARHPRRPRSRSRGSTSATTRARSTGRASRPPASASRS